MHLGGQGGQRGYAMAALLVMVAVMGILMTALLPVWRQQAQREKEAELLFRLYQYSRAIQLFRDRNGGALPPNIDVLVQGKYLRKKYKDPITGEDFQPIFAGQQPGQQGRGGQPQAGQPVSTGIVGVVSKSTATSIRNQRGATTYNQWQVTVADAPPGPGFNVGRGMQPGRGGPQAGEPGRGTGPGRGPGVGGPAGRGTPPGRGGTGPGERGTGPGGGPARGGFRGGRGQ